MKNIYLYLIPLLCIIGLTKANAQDPQYSQFYAAPTYLNPAYAGAGIGVRVIANTRNQWPALPSAYVTHTASIDYNLKEIRSGVGVRFTTDQAGGGSLTSNNLAFQYSYVIPVTRKLHIRTGLETGHSSRSINYAKLTFPDQMSLTDVGEIPTDEPYFGYNDRISYFDFGTGAVMYNEYFWLGAAAHHINTPSQTMTGEGGELPMKLTVHGGVQIPIGPQHRLHSDKKVRTLSPAFNYKHQANFDQLDVGFYVNYEPIIIGLWYRSLPIKQNVPGYFNQDAVIFLFGLKQRHYRVGYSYDLTVSNLGARSAGSHELSLTLEFETNYKPKRRRMKRKEMYIPCPKF